MTDISRLQINTHARLGLGVAQVALEVRILLESANQKLTSLQAISKIPRPYAVLKTAAQECVKYIKFDEEARDAFKSEFVRKLLSEVMSATLKALELISQYYSRRRISASFLLRTGL